MHVGDIIRLHPQSPPLPVVAVEPGRYFVLGGDSNLDGSAPKPSSYIKMNWGFYLEPRAARTTRFLTPSRYDYSKSVALMYGPAIVEPIAFVMERKMMREIKRLVESHN